MPAFHAFGPDHWIVLGLTGGVALALAGVAPRVRRVANDRAVRFGLALGIVGNEVISWIYYGAHGIWGVPLQLCDLAMFVMAWALVGTNRYVAETAYLWGLAGSVQAVLTPDLDVGFPSYRWAQFFLGHCGVVLGAVYLTVRGRVHLTVASVWRVWGISNVYLVVAGLINWRWGINLGYLARKPAHPSVLDWLGPWPSYILAIEGLALVLFFLCLGLSRLVDQWADREPRGI